MFAISYLFFQIFLQFLLLARSDEVVQVPARSEQITKFTNSRRDTSYSNPLDNVVKFDDMSGIDQQANTNPLDNLVKFDDMLGIDLKTSTYIIAALGMVHVCFYGCTLFMPLSYMLFSMWVLVVLYSVFSAVLFVSLPESDLNSQFMLNVWIWYALIFVPLMFLMMLLVALLFVVKSQYHRVLFVLLGIAWYALTLYFIFVVNSYRMQIKEANNIIATTTTTTTTTTSSTEKPVDEDAGGLVLRSLKDWKNEISTAQ